MAATTTNKPKVSFNKVSQTATPRMIAAAIENAQGHRRIRPSTHAGRSPAGTVPCSVVPLFRRALDPQCPSEGVQPVGDALQARPVRGGGDIESMSVVGHVEGERAVLTRQR